MRLALAVPAAVILLWGAGCADAVGPDTALGPAVGTYTLRTIGGGPLPYQYGSGSAHVAQFVVSETLALRADSTFTRQSADSSVYDNPYQSFLGGREDVRLDGRWSRAGARLTLRYTNGSAYGQVETATLASGGVLMRTQATGVDATPPVWSYTR